MPGPTIYYIRHGETAWNAEGRLQGAQDTSLNHLGRKQAAHAGVGRHAFLVAAGYSLAYLSTRNSRFDRIAHAAVRLGLLFAALTLVTGSLFARIMWGSFWNWDPRESSYLLLLFLYGAYLFLRAAVDDPERRARIAAAYALFSAVLMPFLVFVVPRMTRSLHPQTVINPQGKILMDTPTKTVFFAGLLGFTALFLWLLELESRLARVRQPTR